ncbi:LysR family transcriptional regulator [Evansella sp. AB-rgal1]|uniref:LysR family transcriptional regulator n=1 Tax=Evansella sp. AB-rgal1 TaxID=3242696 RepID=UPI00359DF04E
MELHQLKSFYYVATNLNFSRAAEIVSLSQPAVSRQIDSLERHFGLDLFYRIGKRIELTDAGRRLLYYAEQILQLSEQTEKSMLSLKNVNEGELTIGAGTTVGNYVLSPLILEFEKLYPKIQTKLIIANTSTIEEKIKNGSIDIVVIAKSEPHSDLMVEPIFEDEILPLASADYFKNIIRATTISDLSNEVFLLREQGSNTRENIDLLMDKHNFKPKKVIELGTNEAIKHSILRGHGIGFLSKFTTQLEIDHQLLYPIQINERCKRQFSAIYHKGRYTSPIIFTFTSFLKDCIHNYSRMG